ncbi:uncharacterized protein LOC131067406 isoform X2 [Cryptomeria japonica]|uniref:uncharacterized protein LOC131067406 isoform X2 n=1 Tax=Cryptomeria japonica TaxID=3369 RepID=UPI0027D9D9D5|nr:uncharacterized protein LOC131067406 isoform X2 [Cryptomeria japonica]
MEQYRRHRSLMHSSRGSSSMATLSIVSPLSSRYQGRPSPVQHQQGRPSPVQHHQGRPSPAQHHQGRPLPVQHLKERPFGTVSMQFKENHCFNSTSMRKLHRISCQERDSDSASMRALESSEKHSMESFKVGRSGTKPNYICVQKNPPSLALCPATQNCISTAEELNDLSHYVPPWNYNPEDGRGRKKPASKQQAMSELLEVIKTTKPDNFMPQIVEKNDDYVHVEYESPILGFVDDVEFWFPPGKRPIVEYRSASRLGNYDFDINRKRIKALRLALEKKGWESVGY